MPSSFPPARNVEYDSNGVRIWHTDEILGTLRIHDTLGCADDCEHIQALVSQYNLVEVRVAQLQLKIEKEGN